MSNEPHTHMSKTAVIFGKINPTIAEKDSINHMSLVAAIFNASNT